MVDFDPLKGHPIHKNLASLLSLEGRKELDKPHYGISDQHSHSIGRIFSIAQNASLVLKKIEPATVDTNALDELSSTLVDTFNELNAFISNGNAAHIDNARNQINHNASLQLLRLMPVGFEVHPRTQAALNSYRSNARKANQDLRARTKANREQVEAIASRIDEQIGKIDELSALIDAKKSEIDKTVSELREADIERVERQSREALDSIEYTKSTLDDFLKSRTSLVDSHVAESKARAEGAMNDLSKRRDEARDLVQSVGDLLTTGTYADRANKETSKADLFRYLTVGMFTFGLLIIVSNYLIFAVGAAFGQPVVLAETWQALAARIVTGLAVTLPAFYTARESARHRTNADTAKQRELELMTLGPFIELLPDDKKSEIRDRLTDRYFGNEVEPHDVKSPVDSESLAKIISELAKRSGGDVA